MAARGDGVTAERTFPPDMFQVLRFFVKRREDEAWVGSPSASSCASSSSSSSSTSSSSSSFSSVKVGPGVETACFQSLSALEAR